MVRHDGDQGRRRTTKAATLSSRRVSLKVLAAHLGLSPSTVSLVLNQSPVADSIPQTTKDRIFAAARELDYRPDFLAQSLRRQRSSSIGVLVSEISGGYSAEVVSGIEKTLLEAGYFGLVASHYYDPKYLQKCLAMLRDRLVEGYILVNTMIDDAPPLPTVSVSGLRLMRGATNVVIDHDVAARLALAHLSSLGHSRIAFFTGPQVIPDSEDRWRAIRACAREMGLAIRPDLVFGLGVQPVDGAFPLDEFFREGYALGKELVERRGELTALFAFNDPSAIGAMRALHEAGIRVPEDVSVVGFDDIDSAAFHNPGLTTIRQPLRRMGAIAAQSLLDHLSGGEKVGSQLSVDPELVVRQSTGPAPGAETAATSDRER
jgi:DNA-binding LacI/PurR family transcriptional regulator